MTQKHTPTKTEDFIISYKGDHHIVAFRVESHRLSDAEDAAAEIVLACNVHDELVGQLEKMIRMCVKAFADHPDIEEACSVLAKARGEA